MSHWTIVHGERRARAQALLLDPGGSSLDLRSMGSVKVNVEELSSNGGTVVEEAFCF